MGVSVVISGLLILVITVLTTNIIMGSQVTASTISGSTTTYTYTTTVFALSSYHYIIGASTGAFIMLLGGILGFYKQ